MLSIDEAIAQELNIAKNRRKNFDECNERKNNYACRLCVETQPCLDCAEEHEQLAEWLEELKEIKSNGRYVQGNKAGQKIGYRNAIDDFVKSIEEECGYDADINDDCYFEISRTTLLHLAVQLKAGGENE